MQNNQPNLTPKHRLLTRLHGRQPANGGECWVAQCPLHHNGPNRDISVREAEDGAVLVHCMKGCTLDAILHAVALDNDPHYAPDPEMARRLNQLPADPTTTTSAPTPNSSAAAEKSASSAKSVVPPVSYPPTDLGNAQRLAETHGHALRYDVHAHHWRYWTGAHWALDDTGEVHRRAQQVARTLTTAAEALEGPERAAALKHAYRSESPRRLQAMVDLARPLLPVTADAFDRDPWALNLQNGTLDLKTQTLHPHDPAELHARVAAVDYDTDATCPRWQQFLHEVFPDEETVAYAQRLAGYLLTGLTNEQALFFCVGESGKSVFLETLAALLGDYAHYTPFATVERSRRQTNPGLAALQGARLVLPSAPDGDRPLDAALVQHLSSGEPVTARLPRQAPVTFRPTGKLCFADGDAPTLNGAALRRRLQALPFTRTVAPSERDIHLLETLRQELPGILNWALQGLAAWQAQGLDPSAAVVAHTDDLLDLHDPLAAFLDRHFVPDPEGQVDVASLWRTYNAWCANTSTPRLFTQSQQLTRALLQRGGLARTRTNTTRALTGLAYPGSRPTPPNAAQAAKVLRALDTECTQLLTQLAGQRKLGTDGNFPAKGPDQKASVP